MAQPSLRSPKDKWARATNAHQKRLVKAYDTWARKLEHLLLAAVARGATTEELQIILYTQIPALEAKMLALTQGGLIGATNLSGGKKISPRVLSALSRHIAENELLVRGAMVSSISRQLGTKISTGVAGDRLALRRALTALRSRPAEYAGGYWLMIFETQKEIGLDEEHAKALRGEKPDPVRWNLDPGAVHCISSPGRYGCVELAGEYPGGWATLHTLPAGNVTCRGNCRCTLEVKRNGEWRGGF